MVHKIDEIVITGVSCRLPESNNMKEFGENLMNKVDMITEDDRRWPPGYYGLPKRHGKLRNVTKFDASFFSINPKLSNNMDPQLRLLLEVAYEAILDAGVNPETLRGSNTGVYVGCSATESQDILTQDPETVQGYSLIGCQHSMFANRLSFALDFKGPSFAVDTACSSSLLAFQLAIDSIRKGTCDAALVCGVQLTLKPTGAMQFQKLGMLSPRGKCHAFDADADGYVRSEGIVAVLLQKEHAANRVYAEVVNAKSNNDGYKEQGITYPNGNLQAQLLRETYSEARIDPANVVYVECHGTGTEVGDPQEVNAITEVLCQNRQNPLLIGSVKSNMGHCEPASGLASLCKILIAAQSGYIAPNLHYGNPNPSIPGLTDNRLQVVTEKVHIKDGIVGINSFGFGGANTHVILKFPTVAPSNTCVQPTQLPKLLLFGGRTEESVETAFKYFQENHFDNDLYALMNKNSFHPPASFPYRGFLLYNRQNNTDPIANIQRIQGNEQRPVWFIYSGMGTHYKGMGSALENLEIFRDTIKQCSSVLEEFGISVYDLIFNGGSDGMWCAVCICAIQIALTDTLKFLGIKPDGIVGHSFGEMAAGYADDCMTMKETMLCAYYRTKSILEGKFPPGAMAAVGLTWEEAKSRCPDGIIPACHNAKDSVTISGEKEKVAAFVLDLQNEGVFAKEVNSVGIAFHSKCMQTVAKPMKTYLEKVITSPKQRSPKWISSSVPKSNWPTKLGSFCSADYHVNNAVSPVLFYEALEYVPNNAVLIEISPHCLLQAILRRCVPSSCVSVGLLKAKHENNLEFLMQNLGLLYMAGLPVDIQKLYSPVRFPVSRKAPMISPLIRWEHSQDWHVVSYKDLSRHSANNSASNVFIVDPHNAESEDKFLLDHVIDGRVLYPFAGHVVIAWKTLCKLKGLDFQTTSVVFEDICVHRATLLAQDPIKLDVSVSLASDSFEIIDNNQVACSGKIRLPEIPLNICPSSKTAADVGGLTSNEVYKMLRLRGYEYGPSFRPIQKASDDGRLTEIKWECNWIPFIDALLQAILLSETGDAMKLPVRIRHLAIDPVKHVERLEICKGDSRSVITEVVPSLKQCTSGGIMIRDLVAQSVSRRSVANGTLVLEKVHFVKHRDSECLADYPDKLNDIVKYQNVCQRLVGEIARKISSSKMPIPQKIIFDKLATQAFAPDSDVEKEQIVLNGYVDKSDRILAKLLHNICEIDFESKSGLKSMVQLLEDGNKTVHEDILSTVMYNERIMKPLLDIVMENTKSHRIRACALEPSSHVPAKLCRNMQIIQPLLQPEWTLMKATEEDWTNEIHLSKFGLSFRKCDDIEKGVDNGDDFDLILLDCVLHKKVNVQNYLEKVKHLLREDGFVIVTEITKCFEIELALLSFRGQLPSTQQNGLRKYGVFYEHEFWMELFDKSGYTVAAYQGHDLMRTVYLLRKKFETDSVGKNRVVINVDDVTGFSWVEPLKRAVDDVDDNKRLWLTTKASSNTGAVGFGLCLKTEVSKNAIRTLVNCDNVETELLDLKAVYENDLHSNIYRNGCWGSFRHLPVKEGENVSFVETEHAFVNTLVPGDLNSLKWVQSQNAYWKQLIGNDNETKRLCLIHYAALNFRDIMLATGRLSEDAIPGDFVDRDCLLGMEYSGRWMDNGQRLMGLAAAQAMATTVIADRRFTWPVPDHWSLEEAATVPVAYTTAYYSLVVRGRVKAGDKVLIHGGSGGVGQAAIAVALAYNCEVFTTTSSEDKANFLLKKFSALSRDHIATSRSVDFEQQIMQMTNGRGVDVVLNSLSEDKLQASVRCLAEHGRFLEIGKFDLSNNSKLGMSIFLKNITFHGILLDSLFGENNDEWYVVSRLLEDGLNSGVVLPLNTTVFSSDQITEAFRYMAQGKHIGKVLLKIRDDSSTRATLKAVARTLCDPTLCYVITGGLGGFGLELTKWLIKRGAKKILLTSRSGLKTGYQKSCFKTWTDKGVDVRVSTSDITRTNGAEQLIREAQTLGPLGGLFHLAMVLMDGLFENQTEQSFKLSSDVKCLGTTNLDQVTRRLCGDELKYFVVFSSITCGRGNVGQTNYGWSNSVMERIVEQRVADGYPATAIQWGAIGDVGVVVDGMGGDNATVVGGTMPQRIVSCMQSLDAFLTWHQPIVSAFVKADVEFSLSTKASMSRDGCDDVTQSVAQILGVTNLNKIDHNAQFADLGLDSLMGVEIKQMLERRFSLNLSSKEIRVMTMDKLSQLGKEMAKKKSAI